MNIKFKTSHFRHFRRLLSSKPFFKAIVALLLLEAGWIALSGRYPMAFDEDFHLGIIKLYAHHLSPFWSSQPTSADVFGAVTRDPSYLYQYLMSFPYRLLTLFTHDQNIIVIILRFINIGLFAAGLVAMRKLLLKTGASQALINFCLLVFVLIPVASQLAAQINYDNLLLPLTAWSLIWAIDLGQQIARRQLNISLASRLIILCLLTSLVMYAFLPILVAILFYLLVIVWRTYRPLGGRKLTTDIKKNWQIMSWRQILLLVAGLIVSLGLFGERYAVNLARYQVPIPECSHVLSIKRCSAYGPWIRDYNFQINKIDEERNPLVFTGDWLYGMWLRLFFAVGGPDTQFQTRGPLLVPAYGSVLLATLGVAIFPLYVKTIFKRYNKSALALLGLAALLYVAALWLDEFRAYVRTGQPVAINGRYLFPVLLPIMLFIALAVGEWLRGRLNYKLLLASVGLITLLWGGGGLTYVLRSNDNWYWNSSITKDANHVIQGTLGPITPGYYSQAQFLR